MNTEELLTAVREHRYSEDADRLNDSHPELWEAIAMVAANATGKDPLLLLVDPTLISLVLRATVELVLGVQSDDVAQRLLSSIEEE